MNKELLRAAITKKMSMAKTAPKKFYALKRRAGLDNRSHGNLTFCGARQTGRWASMGINLQNLMRPAFKDVDKCIDLLPQRDFELLNSIYGDSMEAISSCLRGMLVAKPGHTLLVGDFASIEARVIAWLAGEEDTLKVFRTHGKIYEHAASQVFKMPIEDIAKDSDERFAGKTTILACGFSGGWKALQKMASNNGVELEDKFCAKIVALWREQNPNIVTYWSDLQDTAIKAIRNPGEKSLVREGVPPIYYKVVRDVLYCQLPSGRLLSYNRPSLEPKRVRYFKIDGEYPINIVYNKEAHGTASDFVKLAHSHGAEIDEFDTFSIRFFGIDSKTYRWGKEYTYGGSLCLSKDTKVLTDSGWKLILNVKKIDKLWDGLDWVDHDGLTFSGLSDTIELDGLRMTKGHKILTTKGWKNASQSEGHNWEKVQLPKSFPLFRLRWKKIFMGHQMYCLWKRVSNARKRIHEGATDFLRLFKFSSDSRSQKEGSRPAEKAPAVQRVEVYGSSMCVADTPSLEKLWGERDHCLQKVAERISSFLKRYGVKLQRGADYRAYKQQKRLLQEELPLGHSNPTSKQQKRKYSNSNSQWWDDGLNGIKEIWDKSYDAFIQNKTRGTTKITIQKGRCQEPVYDLVNSGPLKRFTIMGRSGPRIVHNSENNTQGVARDLLAAALIRLHKAGYKVVLHIHDEAIAEAKHGFGSLTEFLNIMKQPVDWATGLPMGVDGYQAERFRKQC